MKTLLNYLKGTTLIALVVLLNLILVAQVKSLLSYEPYNWQSFAQAYEPVHSIYMPVILKN